MHFRVVFAETVGRLSQWTLTFNNELPLSELQKKHADCFKRKGRQTLEKMESSKFSMNFQTLFELSLALSCHSVIQIMINDWFKGKNLFLSNDH